MNFKSMISALVIGFLFGCGLIVSQMVNPDKVINFLDLTGNWDPSLALVMVGALIVFGPIYWFVIRNSSKPKLADDFCLPTKKHLDSKLVIGAAIFGIGWGLMGICPGPAITNLASLDLSFILFTLSMLIGMKLAQLKR